MTEPEPKKKVYQRAQEAVDQLATRPEIGTLSAHLRSSIVAEVLFAAEEGMIDGLPLTDFAAAGRVLTHEEKSAFADACHPATQHKFVERAIEEFAQNMGFANEGLPAMGLLKIAHCAAMVARCQAIGMDPEILRVTREEFDREAIQMMAELAYEGVPVQAVKLDRECTDCNGTGLKTFLRNVNRQCSSCKGTGRITFEGDKY